MMLPEEALVQFEALQEHHIDEIMTIAVEAYPDPWTDAMLRDELKNPLSRFYVAWIRKALVGYGGFWLVVDEAHITSVTVRDDYRGQGIGRQLLEYLLDRAREAGAASANLEVRASNEPAIRLYAGMGFKAVGRRKGYYAKTNEDALLMLKDPV